MAEWATKTADAHAGSTGKIAPVAVTGVSQSYVEYSVGYLSTAAEAARCQAKGMTTSGRHTTVVREGQSRNGEGVSPVEWVGRCAVVAPMPGEVVVAVYMTKTEGKMKWAA